MWKTEFGGYTIENGANWIEGIPQAENPIWTIAQQIGLKGNYTNQEDGPIKPLLVDHRGVVPAAEAAKLHTKLARALLGAQNISCDHQRQNKSDISLRAALTLAGWPLPEEQTALERTLEFFVVDWDFEFPPQNVSIFNFFAVGHADSWKETCSGNDRSTYRMGRARTAALMGMVGNFSWESPRYFVTDPRGYGAVADFVMKDIDRVPQGEQCAAKGVILNKTVERIKYSDPAQLKQRCEVHTTDGWKYSAKYCISTFSAGVVNHAVSTETLFEPRLPQWKSAAFARAQNGIYTKVFLQFPSRFWLDADYVLYAHPSRRGYLAVWQDLESHNKFLPAGAHILMVTVVQADSIRLETQPENKTIQEIQQVLRGVYGAQIPQPTAMHIPKWHRDPAFRGCWSNIKVGTDKSNFELMQRQLGGLVFAGEATDYDFNGFTLGGFTSGERAAHHVMTAGGFQS